MVCRHTLLIIQSLYQLQYRLLFVQPINIQVEKQLRLSIFRPLSIILRNINYFTAFYPAYCGRFVSDCGRICGVLENPAVEVNYLSVFHKMRHCFYKSSLIPLFLDLWHLYVYKLAKNRQKQCGSPVIPNLARGRNIQRVSMPQVGLPS